MNTSQPITTSRTATTKIVSAVRCGPVKGKRRDRGRARTVQIARVARAKATAMATMDRRGGNIVTSGASAGVLSHVNGRPDHRARALGFGGTRHRLVRTDRRGRTHRPGAVDDAAVGGVPPSRSCAPRPL